MPAPQAAASSPQPITRPRPPPSHHQTLPAFRFGDIQPETIASAGPHTRMQQPMHFSNELGSTERAASAGHPHHIGAQLAAMMPHAQISGVLSRPDAAPVQLPPMPGPIPALGPTHLPSAPVASSIPAPAIGLPAPKPHQAAVQPPQRASSAPKHQAAPQSGQSGHPSKAPPAAPPQTNSVSAASQPTEAANSGLPAKLGPSQGKEQQAATRKGQILLTPGPAQVRQPHLGQQTCFPCC